MFSCPGTLRSTPTKISGLLTVSKVLVRFQSLVENLVMHVHFEHVKRIANVHIFHFHSIFVLWIFALRDEKGVDKITVMMSLLLDAKNNHISMVRAWEELTKKQGLRQLCIETLVVPPRESKTPNDTLSCPSRTFLLNCKTYIQRTSI